MYKILNSQGLGVSGKQNELIELALTHNFNGVEVDISDLVGRHDALGKEFACQFLKSAKIDMGTFCLPAALGGTDDEYQSSIANLETIIDLANSLNAKRCYIKIEPTSSTLTFQENFEQHQTRLREIGEAFEAHGIKLGVSLQASTIKDAEGEFKFVQTAEEILTLAKTGQANVGLALDCWEWVVGGGTIEQLKELNPTESITEVRLGDVSADADLANICKNARTKLPGDAIGSFSVLLTKQPAVMAFVTKALACGADSLIKSSPAKIQPLCWPPPLLKLRPLQTEKKLPLPQRMLNLPTLLADR